MSVTISDDYINEIISILGYPLLNFEDDDFELDKDDIKTLVITPTLREFYKWFPLPVYEEQYISGSFSIDFPSDAVYNVIDARLNANAISGIQNANPFVNSFNYTNNYSIQGYNKFGTPYSYGYENSNIIEKSLQYTKMNVDRSFKCKANLFTRKLEGYTNRQGVLSITWASFSWDFSNIPFDRINEVIMLCQVNLLDKIISIRKQQNSDLPTDFDISYFEKIRDDYKIEVLDKWKKLSKVVILRG